MKVLLIQPPIEDFYDTSIRTYPLGLLYVAARIGDTADVAVLDARTGSKSPPLKDHDFPEVTPFYKENVSTPFSFLSRYRRYGLSRDAIGEAIEREKPDIVGIASMCSAYEKEALEAATTAKETSREIVTVLGGIHPTLFPKRVLSALDVDYVVRGDGETPFFELVSAISRGKKNALAHIGGLCFRHGNGIHLSGVNTEQNIDLLPRRTLLDANRYRIGKKRYTFFLTSRGCPNSCAFCGKPPAPYRQRTLANIEQEIDECANLGIDAIDFEDDMLNLDKGRFSDILRLFVARGLTLSAMNGIYPRNTDVPALRLMYEAGFRRLNFALVDTSESVLRSQGRGSQAAFLRLLPYLEESPFLTEVHFIVGLPEQLPEVLLDTLVTLMGKRLLLGPSIFYLSPGSPLYVGAVEADRELPFRAMRSSFMLPFNPRFPRTITFTMVKLVRFINHVKGLLDSQTSSGDLHSGSGITRLSDLLDGPVTTDPVEHKIIETLLREKRFLAYDAKRGDFFDEPQDPSLVRAFFDKATGKLIKGHKTHNSLLVDL